MTAREIPSEDGFALPSVLMLVTILMLVAFSLMSLQYFRRELTMRQISRTKAEYAAQSGVASILQGVSSCEEILLVAGSAPRTFAYDDGSMANVRVLPWGLSAIALSEGTHLRSHAFRRALLSARPSTAFSCALVLGTRNHQLVLTGRTQIRGDVSLPSGGVTLGTLKDYPTPLRLPIDGKVVQAGPVFFPEPDRQYLQKIRERLEGILTADPALLAGFQRLSPGNDTSLCKMLATAPDTLMLCLLNGSFFLSGQIERLHYPLVIAVDGEATIDASARIAGPVAIIASGAVNLSLRSESDGLLIYSRKRIRIHPGVRASGQFISPEIRVDSGGTLLYPSLLAVLPRETAAGDSCNLTLSSRSLVEGFACVLADSSRGSDKSCLILEPSSSLAGAAYSNSFMTMDGNVTGSVLSQDFTFVHPPTLYRGWIRGGTIDRQRLPDGFLTPPVFGGKISLDVLTWL